MEGQVKQLHKIELGLVKIANALNFNYKSYKAWVTLLVPVVSAVVAILKIFGIEVTPEQTKDVTLAITAILNVLLALGILVVKQDNHEKGNDK